MKKGIHPAYHFVEIQLNDGTTYKTRTTYGSQARRSRWTSIRRPIRPGPAASSN